MADDFQKLARNLIGPLWPWIVERMGVLPEARGGTGVAQMPAFFAHKNGTNQTGIVTATHTKVTWSTEIFDTAGNFASSRFTPLAAGTYLIIATLYWTSMTDQAFMLPEIYKNGAFYASVNTLANGVGDQGSSSMALLTMNGTTDYVEAFAYQNTGSNKDISGTVGGTYFCGAWIAP